MQKQGKSHTINTPKPPLAEDRKELALFLRAQISDEKDQLYQESHVSRGAGQVYHGSGPGYNQLHNIDFYRELDRLAYMQKDVRILDVGCGLGYFLKDLRDHATKRGYADRIELKGITLTRKFKVNSEVTGEPYHPEPVLGKDTIHIAHAENMPFPNNHFDLLVSTFGPLSYYHGPIGEIDRQNQLLDEFHRVTNENGRILIYDVKNRKDVYFKKLIQDFHKRHPDTNIISQEETDNIRIQIQRKK